MSAKQPIRSPRASDGTNRARCSSVPNWSSGSVHAEVWTATVTPTPASARDSSSSTRMYDTKSAPAPPYSSGTQTPMSPRSPSFASSSRGKPWSRSHFGRVRLDLGVRELPRQRLDLVLLRRQLEVHGGQTIRMRLAAILLAVLALSACGGHKTRLTGRGRPRVERRARPERQRGRRSPVRRRRAGDPGRRADPGDALGRRALERRAAVRRRDHAPRTAQRRSGPGDLRSHRPSAPQLRRRRARRPQPCSRSRTARSCSGTRSTCRPCPRRASLPRPGP